MISCWQVCFHLFKALKRSVHDFLFHKNPCVPLTYKKRASRTVWSFTRHICANRILRYCCQLESSPDCAPNISINKSFWSSWRLNNCNTAPSIPLRKLLPKSGRLGPCFEKRGRLMSTISANNSLECTLQFTVCHCTKSKYTIEKALHFVRPVPVSNWIEDYCIRRDLITPKKQKDGCITVTDITYTFHTQKPP